MRLYLQEHETEPDCRTLEFEESMPWNGAKLTAFPAGHILGAAQLLIEFRGERLLYTGDMKLRQPLCGDTAVSIPCSHLIIESTFGLPIYKLLSRDEACEQIIRFARECLAESTVPAFIGYALGRGQEIAHVLCQAGIRTAVHGAIARFIPVYEEAGYSFCAWERYEAKATAGKALVVVPSHGAALEASGKNIRLAYVSGWAALANARASSGAEELVPYSDHADFDELLSAVKGSEASRIDIVHGYTEPFANLLRLQGYNAHAPQRSSSRSNMEAVEG
jgi:putative mRNA 3-end processing factor